MLESFITLCCVFAVIAYLTTRRLGLLDPVPRDPKARVAAYTSSILSKLKEQLIQSRLKQCEPARVSYVNGATEGVIWLDGGNVHFEEGNSKSELPLGDMGNLTFALQGSELSVSIVAAESSGAEHSVQVSLPLAS